MEQNIYLDGAYLENNPLYHVEDSPWKAQQILKMLQRHSLQPGTVCEVGCGAGEVLRQLQLHLPATTTCSGYEISPQAYALCRQRENDRLEFHCADLLEQDTPPFDLLLCIDVFEHVEDYVGFLRKLRPRAKHKIFHIPLDMSVRSILKCVPIVQARATVGHLHYFMKETALATLRDTGYEIVDHFYTPVSLERGTTFKSKLGKLPRTALSRVNQDFAVRLLGGYSLMVLAT